MCVPVYKHGVAWRAKHIIRDRQGLSSVAVQLALFVFYFESSDVQQ